MADRADDRYSSSTGTSTFPPTRYQHGQQALNATHGDRVTSRGVVAHVPGEEVVSRGSRGLIKSGDIRSAACKNTPCSKAKSSWIVTTQFGEAHS
jgi:hypothetical protein